MKIEGSRHGVGHHGSKKSEISPPTPNKKKVDFPASGWHLGRDRRLGFDTTDPSQLMQISGQTHNTHTHTRMPFFLLPLRGLFRSSPVELRREMLPRWVFPSPSLEAEVPSSRGRGKGTHSGFLRRGRQLSPLRMGGATGRRGEEKVPRQESQLQFGKSFLEIDLEGGGKSVEGPLLLLPSRRASTQPIAPLNCIKYGPKPKEAGLLRGRGLSRRI